MATVSIQVGDVRYFGWKNTRNEVVNVGALRSDGTVPVELKGPRGGVYSATAYADGRIRKN